VVTEENISHYSPKSKFNPMSSYGNNKKLLSQKDDMLSNLSGIENLAASSQGFNNLALKVT